MDENQFSEDRKFHSRQICTILKISMRYLYSLIEYSNLTVRKKKRQYIFTVQDLSDLQWWLNRKKKLKNKPKVKNKKLSPNKSLFFDFRDFSNSKFSDYKRDERTDLCIYNYKLHKLQKIDSIK
ncbi:hypothetical protein [Francisella philomiragia]|uniref:hypothetical protein n=1 Tax=Francisella philomiragia TaxID=28110 RepID=UPI0022436E7A|nr:hypothetical protein [Francisella philomiragia]